MRIFIVNAHMEDEIGGSEIQCDLIARLLLERKHEVLYGVANPRRQVYQAKYKCVALKTFSRDYYRTLKRFRPDIVYWRYNKNKFLSSVIITKILGFRIIFAISSFTDIMKMKTLPKHINKEKQGKITIRDIIRYRHEARDKIKALINHLGFYFVDGAISLNYYYLDKLPVKKQVKIYNSMEISIVEFKWEKPFVVWVANLKSIKNPEKYIEVAKSLEGNDIDFLMVGAVQEKKYDYVKDQKNLPKNLYYLGPKTLEEVNGIIKESLFLVDTWNREGFGNNSIQAWLLGKPTVSLYCDPESIIQKNGIGYLSGNISSMVRDVSELIENNDLRTSLGEKAKNLAQKAFDPEVNVGRLEEFMRSIISPKSGQTN